MVRPETKPEKPAKADNPNKAGGRAKAPGLGKEREYAHPDGQTITVSKREWLETYKDQGYRPAEELEVSEIPEVPAVDDPVEELPAPTDPETEQPA